MIDGSKIKPGDAIIGLPSNGLHTNGYSLARKVLFEKMQLTPSSQLPGVAKTLGDELLRVHRNYQPLLASLPQEKLKGLAHITGGGLVDNLPRVLPATCDAIIETTSWKVPAIFGHIEQGGGIDAAEMFQVFNMGIGMTLVVASKDADQMLNLTKGRLIGRIEPGKGKVQLAF
jgi:phosphoribosylformylglycinamidine cyclo-ligase